MGKVLGVADRFGIAPRVSVSGPPWRRLVALFRGGAGPLCVQRRATHRRWVAERIGAVDGEKSVVGWAPVSAARSVGDREFIEGVGERSSHRRRLAAVQVRDRQRRGRPGGEAAVSILQEVSVRSGWGRVVSSSLRVKGSQMGEGPAQGSLSNYRLKLAARGRLGADARLRTRAAA